MRRLSAVTAALILLAAAPGAAAAQATLDSQAASRIIDGCVAHSTARHQSHAIAVFDDGGHPVAILRMDGNPPGVTEFAMRKAAAVAYWRFSTQGMAAAVRDTPGFADAPQVVTVPGGVPVFGRDGRAFLGAVGVSGEAPADDAACAEAGIRAAGFFPARQSGG